LADAGQPASFEKLPAKTLARLHEDLGLLTRQMNTVDLGAADKPLSSLVR
jgi:hypothetical protein